MKPLAMFLLPCLLLFTASACHHFGDCDDFDGDDHFCDVEPDCHDRPDCRDDWDDDWDDWTDDWDDPYVWCEGDEDCDEGFVCAPDGFCVETVMGCPLTDECLADPEGYVPDWQGIDPMFVGSFEGQGVRGRVRVFIDFYDDHLYGQGEVVVEPEDGYQEWLAIVVTGTREGAELWGQVVDPNAWERQFDAVFSATLLDASEMHGLVTVSSDEGVFEASFILYRTSPCGCETDGTCELNQDCGAGQICLDGTCVDICLDDSDCEEGQICDCHVCIDVCPDECCADEDCEEGATCVDGWCIVECQTECCADEDCAEGGTCVDGACVYECQHECCEDTDCPEGDVCIENACQTPCELNCQCEEGEICEDGFCQVGEPPVECTSDCDCAYDAGERCIDGICQMP